MIISNLYAFGDKIIIKYNNILKNKGKTCM
nr:MAG TPA: hypothetical protein [Caudoviricetes sp.]